MADKKLENFKNIVLKAMGLESQDQIEMFEQIPDEIHASIFKNNFNENYVLARNVILNKFDQDSYLKIEKEKSRIHDMTKASRHLIKETTSPEQTKILFLTDTDNDGSLAQANIKAFLRGLPEEMLKKFDTLYCQQVNGNTARGFTVDLVDLWIESNPEYKTKPFTIVTADNGINSREEQEKINEKYPNAILIVTDHHNPDEDNVVVPNNNTMVVNPRFKPNKYFKEKNISGANVLGTLLEKVLLGYEESNLVEIKNKDLVIEHMREISRTANLLDYVDTDISDKPLKDHLIEKYASLGALMNVNNSLNKIIVSNKTDEEVKELFSDVEGLDLDVIVKTIKQMKEQNVLAQKLYTLQSRFEFLPEEDKIAVSKDSIYSDMIVELEKPDSPFVKENINPNFVEQLRPFIYTYATSNDLLDYEQGIMDEMIKVYSNLKRLERTLQTEFGKAELMNIQKNENSTIMFPKNSNHLELLNRKLLGKIYNEENNGFLMILDSVSREKATGSFRSIYRIQDILKDKEKIENLFNIKLSFQGHDKAAGFFIEKQDDTELTPKIISDVNSFINRRLETLKNEDKRSYSHLIQTNFNFETIDVFNKYNKAVKGSLTNMQSLSPVVQFTKSTYITNSKTLEDESLQEIVKNKKYGYVPANISFNGETIILPTEMLRTIAANNFRDGIQVSFMNDGAFIGNKLIPDVNKKKLHKIKAKDSGRQKMIDFYEEHYRDKHFVELPIENLKNSPFFKANKFGLSEYKRFESTVIRILDKSNSDLMVVADTEANGLGNAPKIANLGVVELSIDENSGNVVREAAFKKLAFKSTTGKRFILNKEQLSGLRKLSRQEYLNLSFEDKSKVLVSIDGSKNDYQYAESFEGFKSLYNYKKQSDGTVKINRELKAEIGSVFIKDRDMKISEKIATLTAIDNTLLNKIGMSSKEADEIFTKRYEGKKCIFQAHNLPYDLGVIKGNMKNFYKLMTDFDNGNLLNDSAIYSREQKLAYDPIGISVFEDDVVPALKGIQFFHSSASDLSLKNFFDNDKDETLPDRTGRFVLKKKEGRVSVIDTKENTEVKVKVAREFINSKDLNGDIEDYTDIELLKNHIRVVDMPMNAIKYSVQALSDYDMIRAMILSSSDFNVKAVEVPSEFSASKEKMEYFMMNYHFDASFDENFSNFAKILDSQEYADIFVTRGYIEEEAARIEKDWMEEQQELPPAKRKKRKPNFKTMVGEDPKIRKFKEFANNFLEENEDLQCKFHETWAYKKVLQLVNPTKDKLKNNDLVDLVAYRSSLSVDKVKAIMEEAIEYKSKYGLTNVLQKEPHNNLFFDECDVVMESILTFKRPTDRNYNSYNHSTEEVVDMYLGNIFRTTCQHMRSQTRRMAIDSYSRKQALSYKRGYKSDYIEESQRINPEDVKFKFSKDTLQQDQFAYGSLKQEVSEDLVADLSKKLEFVVRNEQMRFSVDNGKYSSEDIDMKKSLEAILEQNEETVNSYKDELSEYFDEVYFSKKESNMKKCLELVQSAILTGREIKVPKMEPLLKREKNLLISLTEKFSEIATGLGISDIEEFKLEDLKLDSDKVGVKENHELLTFLMKVPEISEEQLQDDYDYKLQKLKETFPDNEEKVEEIMRRKAIIEEVNIKRQNNAKHMFKFDELLENTYSKILREKQEQKEESTLTSKAKLRH